MARIFDERFEGGYEETWAAEGEQITSSNSKLVQTADPSTLSGGTPTGWGTSSLQSISYVGDADCYVGTDLAGGAETLSFTRIDIHYVTFPTGLAENSIKAIAEIWDTASASEVWRLHIQKSSTGFRFLMRDWTDGSSSDDVSADISLDTTYTVEMKYDGSGNGSFEWKIDDVSQGTNVGTGTGPTEVDDDFRIGAAVNEGTTIVQEIWFDRVAIDDTTWVGLTDPGSGRSIGRGIGRGIMRGTG